MLNEITIHGYCGKDPQKETVQGIKGPYSKTTVSVGVSRDFGDQTDWFYCVFYGAKADTVEKWFRKGSQIIVKGRMESYKPKNDPNPTRMPSSAVSLARPISFSRAGSSCHTPHVAIIE